jgi:hypothetical protein
MESFTMKVIAFYLPQFHEIPENNEWWGENFTEWVNVKAAKSLYDGHEQPRVPLNNNYYNLIDDSVKKWQVDLAKKYGVYGFCYYHYWFNGKMLLEKPMEQMLNNPEIDLPFCVCWANEPWTKAWVGNAKKVLIPQFYGEKKEWKEHFDYMLPFFKDHRYIKNADKPLFIIYRPTVIPRLNEMLDYWNELAVESGFPGIDFAHQTISLDLDKNKDDSRFTFDIEYQPDYAFNDMNHESFKRLKKIRRDAATLLEKIFGIDLLRYGRSTLDKITQTKRVDYDKAWNAILNRKVASSKNIPGAFVGWDNSPRHKERARIYVGDSPEKFKEYFSALIKKAKNEYHKDMIFIFAWNEWAEGGYLEPDERYGYGYLEAIREALIDNGEFPKE